MVVLVYGGGGWVGSQLVPLLADKARVELGEARLENKEDVLKEVRKYHDPPRSEIVSIVNCAGIVGKPNVDWCESHRDETITGNLVGPLNLVSCAKQFGIHVTHFSTGCIYNFDNNVIEPREEDCPFPATGSFSETDPPNYTGSFYSKIKALAENVSIS